MCRITEIFWQAWIQHDDFCHLTAEFVFFWGRYPIVLRNYSCAQGSVLTWGWGVVVVMGRGCQRSIPGQLYARHAPCLTLLSLCLFQLILESWSSVGRKSGWSLLWTKIFGQVLYAIWSSQFTLSDADDHTSLFTEDNRDWAFKKRDFMGVTLGISLLKFSMPSLDSLLCP